MTTIVGAFATSHATAFFPPERWDRFRGEIRAMYRERYGELPPEQPEALAETDAANVARVAAIQTVHRLIRKRIGEAKPDAVLLFGNDQNEDFSGEAIPQFAIFTGVGFRVEDRLSGSGHERKGNPALSGKLLAGVVEAGIDVAQITALRDGCVRAHAHAQICTNLIPDDTPVVPIYVNAITAPMAPAWRCRALGEAIGSVLRSMEGARVVIGTSGGLSHFTFGYPYGLLKVPRAIGSIDVGFDRNLIGWLRAGRLDQLAQIDDEDLLQSGNVEFRQALACLSALPGGVQPEALVYEPFYRGLMGFWAGYWHLVDRQRGVAI